MGLDRRTVSACLLGLAAIVFYLILLTSTPSGAQTGGTTTSSNCPGARVVNTTTGTGNKQSPVFGITGTSFLISVQSEATSQDPQLAGVTVFVYPQGETVNFVTDFSVEGGNDDSSVVNAGPGRFYLRVVAANVDYTITVEDCTGSGGGGTTQTNQSNQGGVTAIANPPGKPQRERSIINVPNRPLPPSGGLPVYGVVTGFVLTGAGLLALGLVIWRGSRR